ncbi:hypothetical protein AAVH_19589 [Aphelenchoides avenae]|nr:hypothetical protein AAVH_19589 [Aphelenchus avenae]
MECYVDEACAQLLTTVQREGFGGKYAFELLRSDGVKRYLWNPTTFLSMGKSYELLDQDDGGKVVASFDNATFSMSKCGTLCVQHDLNDFLLDTIVMIWAALREKHRCDEQRAAASSSAAAH